MFNIESFIKENLSKAKKYAEAYGLGTQDAEDLAQIVLSDFFVKYSQNRINVNYNPTGYLYNLLRWRITDKFRKNKIFAKNHVTIGEDNNLDELTTQNTDNKWKKELLIKATAEIKNEVNPKYYKLFIEQAIKNESAAFSAKKYNTTIPVAHLAKHRVGKKVILAAKRILKENGV